MTHQLVRRFGWAGRPVGGALRQVEARLLRASDAVVVISEDFRPTLDAWRVRPDRVSVIENWAPVEELPVRSSDSTWSREHGLCDNRVALYAGTLGLKHDPGLLLELAVAARANDDIRIVVISEGPAREWLEARG